MTATPAATRDVTAAAVRRNMLLLAGGMAGLYGMVELGAAAAALTFEATGGPRSLGGLAPALFLATGALTALPAGRAMDRFGRVPVLAGGFGAGILGSSAAALGAFTLSLAPVVLGFLLIGASAGTVMLARTAAADMHPPERRGRAIGLVLFGAVFGALLGPLVFIPLASAGRLEASSLGPAWLGAAGFMAIGLVLMSRVRPDPRDIARSFAPQPSEDAPAPGPIREIVRRPGIATALIAAVASWSAMVAIMTLTGSALAGHGHGSTAIFPVLSAHFVGMFALFLVVGRAIDRAGRRPALAGGLVLLGISALALPPALESVALSALALFGIGLGWSFAYVAATTELAEGATVSERGKLLGFADLLSGLTGAALTVAAGIALATVGLAAVGVGAAVLTGGSAAWIARAPSSPA